MNEWFLIFGMFILTFIPRYIPLGLAGKVKIPEFIESSLKFVPIAVLTSIISQSSLIREGELLVNFSNYYLHAALVSFVVSRMTNRLFVVVATGMVSFYIFKCMF